MSSESSNTRKYELKRRAERQDETRRRIVEAAVSLHTSLGPSRATIAAIAEHAGVARPTVYSHFPDERSLFLACSGHVRDTTPSPDPTPWSSIDEPERRLRVALAELYGYYAKLEPLLDNVIRDAKLMPIVREIGEYRLQHLREAREVLVAGWDPEAHDGPLRAAVGHALDFRTWQSLVRDQGCAEDVAVDLMVALVRSAASGLAQPSLGSAETTAPTSAGSVSRL
jgi:AcrR family transcriptional regulator